MSKIKEKKFQGDMSKIKERIIIPGEWSMKNITDFWKLQEEVNFVLNIVNMGVTDDNVPPSKNLIPPHC